MRGVVAVIAFAGLFALTTSNVVARAAAPAPASYDVVVPIERGVEHVRQEVDGIARLGGSRIPLEQVAAQSALTWVQSRLSPAISAVTGGADDLQTAFRLQSGLCGQIVESFMQIMQRVGVRVLPVQFFYVADGERQSHVAAQVWWSGRWHYVDPTWGVLFEKRGSVLGPAQVLALSDPARYALMNRLVPWTDANVRRGGAWSPLGYLTAARDRQVVMNGAGRVAPPRTLTGPRAASWSLALMPDYVGTYAPYARQLVSITQTLSVPAGARTLVLTVRGKLCGGLGVLHAGASAIAFADVPDAGELRVPVTAGSVALTVDGGDSAEACAVLLSGLRAE